MTNMLQALMHAIWQTARSRRPGPDGDGSIGSQTLRRFCEPPRVPGEPHLRSGTAPSSRVLGLATANRHFWSNP